MALGYPLDRDLRPTVNRLDGVHPAQQDGKAASYLIDTVPYSNISRSCSANRKFK